MTNIDIYKYFGSGSVKKFIKDYSIEDYNYIISKTSDLEKTNKVKNLCFTARLLFYFKYKNKIIEYHGEYWHNDIDDKIRKDYLILLGYDYLEIYSSEYNRSKKDNQTIEKCVNFLLNEN